MPAGVTVKPFDARIEAGIGTLAYRLGDPTLRPDPSWKGRVIDALGRPIDGLGDLVPGARAVPLDAAPPPAMERARVTKPLRTGVRALDLFTPLCLGQRIGIFAGSGVGKSTLLAMLAGATGFDSVVVALVGERGREVREFLEGRDGAEPGPRRHRRRHRRREPDDAPAGAEDGAGHRRVFSRRRRIRAAHRRFGDALRPCRPRRRAGGRRAGGGAGLSAERVLATCRASSSGPAPASTAPAPSPGIFSVLVDGDDHNDPVADSIRGTLDGHIVLDRAIAEQGRYPAVHLLGSISRLASEVWTPEQRELVRRLKAMMARFEETRDLRLMGGYRAGEDAELDQAILLVPRIYEALRQEPGMAASAGRLPGTRPVPADAEATMPPAPARPVSPHPRAADQPRASQSSFSARRPPRRAATSDPR